MFNEELTLENLTKYWVKRFHGFSIFHISEIGLLSQKPDYNEIILENFKNSRVEIGKTIYPDILTDFLDKEENFFIKLAQVKYKEIPESMEKEHINMVNSGLKFLSKVVSKEEFCNIILYWSEGSETGGLYENMFKIIKNYINKNREKYPDLFLEIML